MWTAHQACCQEAILCLIAASVATAGGSSGSVGSTEIMIYNPEASSRHTMVTIHGANDVHGHGDNVRMMTGAAHNNENSAVNYFRITFDNGNISSALIKLYGVQ